MPRPTDFHAQDWLLVIEALSQWRLELRSYDPKRADRAAELITAIATAHGLDPVYCVEQIDRDWSG